MPTAELAGTTPKVTCSNSIEWAAVIAPEADPKAHRSWRRLVSGVHDSPKRDAFSLDGDWLEEGRAYELPVGALVVACDTYDVKRRIVLYQVEVGDLTEIKAWEQRARLGARALNYISRRMPALSPTLIRARAMDTANRWNGRCYRCGRHVGAGEGFYRWTGDAHHVVHGTCPPRPVERNRYEDYCRTCGGWLEVGEGILVYLGGCAPWPTHEGDCPVVPAAAPVRENKFGGWCEDCGEWMDAGQGVWDGAATRHGPICPPVPDRPWPTWKLRHRWGTTPTPGDTVRMRIPQGGQHLVVPTDAPGYRVIDESMVEAIVTVTEVHERAWGGHEIRACAATFSEAESILARDLELALDTRPTPSTLKGSWKAEKIGPLARDRHLAVMAVLARLAGQPIGTLGGRPWLAELTGLDARYGLSREFLASRRDYSNANSRGTRGVRHYWTLAPNRIYEAQQPLSWRESRRVFLRVTAEGDIEEISREQAEAWLRYGLLWLEMSGHA